MSNPLPPYQHAIVTCFYEDANDFSLVKFFFYEPMCVARAIKLSYPSDAMSYAIIHRQAFNLRGMYASREVRKP